jgi:hypothetical protein
MAQSSEDFLVELAAKGDATVLERLPTYLDSHYVQVGNVPAERNRLIVAFRDKAPQTELSDRILDIISEGG